jgi:hypothetical protein
VSAKEKVSLVACKMDIAKDGENLMALAYPNRMDRLPHMAHLNLGLKARRKAQVFLMGLPNLMALQAHLAVGKALGAAGVKAVDGG